MDQKIILSKPAMTGAATGLFALGVYALSVSAQTHQSPKRILFAMAGCFIGSCLQYVYKNHKKLSFPIKAGVPLAAASLVSISTLATSDHPQNAHIYLLSFLGSFSGSQAYDVGVKAYQNCKKRRPRAKLAATPLNPLAEMATKATAATAVSGLSYLFMISKLGDASYKSAISAIIATCVVRSAFDTYGACVRRNNPGTTPSPNL